MSPKPFLHRLGIKPNRKGKFSDRYRKTIEGMYPERSTDDQDADIMSIDVIDLLFADEQMAVETLGSNFDRLANSMDRLSTSPVFAKGKLNRVCELGGGSGIVGMWLAANNQCEFCEVVDHAKNPLAIGRKWAADRSIKNIDFRRANYAELAAAGSQDFDFAFAEHGVDLSYVRKSPDLSDAPDNKGDSPVLQRYKELAGAFNSLLLSDGVGLIGGGSPSPASLSLLCKALREHHLTIDWKLSSNEDGFQLYVRPGGIAVLESTEDEALAILADALPKQIIPPAEALSLEIMFRQGKRYVEVCYEEKGAKFQCSIFQCAGLACLFQRSSKGPQPATLFSAGRMHSWAKSVLLDASERSITAKFIDERLASILDD